MLYVGIDPSVRCTGVAAFIDGEYAWCAIVRARDVPHACALARDYVAGDAYGRKHSTRMWIELPQIYPGSKQKGDPNDLISVAAVAGAYASAIHATVEFVSPRGWKGQVPKHVIEERIFQRLDRKCKQRLEADLKGMPKSLQNNALDAVGIVMKGIGRI